MIDTERLKRSIAKVERIRDSMSSMPFKKGKDNVTAYNMMNSALKSMRGIRDDAERNRPRESTMLKVSLERESDEVLIVKVDVGTHWVEIPFGKDEFEGAGTESRKYEREVGLNSMFNDDDWASGCYASGEVKTAERGRIRHLDWRREWIG